MKSLEELFSRPLQPHSLPWELGLSKRTQRCPTMSLAFGISLLFFLSIPNKKNGRISLTFRKENSKDTLGVESACLHCVRRNL